MLKMSVKLAVLGFFAILLLFCADNDLPPFPEFVGEESSSSLSSFVEFSSSSELSSSSVATYTVTYNAGTSVTDVAVPANQTKTYDVALTLNSAMPTRTGYAFASWNTSANGTGMSYIPGASYTDNADVVLYAQWTANTYAITYNANDGTGAPDNQTKSYDVALTLSSAKPTRTGYSFARWNTSVDGTGTSYASGASYADNADVTLYAQWTANIYTVTYNANGGTGVPTSQTKTHDVALTLRSTVPTRTGYTFTYWNTSVDGSGIFYTPEDSYTANAPVTLYAQWTANTYAVTYNINGGTAGWPEAQTKTYDVALTLRSTVPTRTGYDFVGWNTSADGSGISYTSGASYTDNAGITLYAQWKCSQTSIVNGPSVSYGGETYESVVICDQTWLKRNLNYYVEGSKCGNGRRLSDENTATCDTYGRLYDWATAMGLSSSCNSSYCASQINAKHKGICPNGWHIPRDDEWKTLGDNVGGWKTAGTKLKATSGWGSGNGNGTDNYGFSALPGGDGGSDGSFNGVGSYGCWWSASEYGSGGVYDRYIIHYDYEDATWTTGKGYLLSVRCLQD